MIHVESQLGASFAGNELAVRLTRTMIFASPPLQWGIPPALDVKRCQISVSFS